MWAASSYLYLLSNPTRKWVILFYEFLFLLLTRIRVKQPFSVVIIILTRKWVKITTRGSPWNIQNSM